ncbi:hypothetical protein AVEN_161819-1 [Araneus ventricosus]|uniref:HTH CENPB-type domain-containing protein n=1 Tax=Araneus ventricosus TaxID=182803 RepID=A0A4Y2MG64_ARAVE|nr:hypothetical protein AVEN_161819-1 [Araneus ventricosus]
MRDKNIPISGPFIIEKALQFAKALGYDEFQVSNGWLEKFERRHGFMAKVISGESKGVDDNDSENLITETLKIKIDQILKEDEESRGFILREHFPLIDDDCELTEDELLDIEEYEFTKETIENSIKGMKRGGAPVCDGWTTELAQECYFIDSESFTEVLNTCFRYGFLPENEKIAGYFDPQRREDLKCYKSRID